MQKARASTSPSQSPRPPPSGESPSKRFASSPEIIPETLAGSVDSSSKNFASFSNEQVTAYFRQFLQEGGYIDNEAIDVAIQVLKQKNGRAWLADSSSSQEDLKSLQVSPLLASSISNEITRIKGESMLSWVKSQAGKTPEELTELRIWGCYPFAINGVTKLAEHFRSAGFTNDQVLAFAVMNIKGKSMLSWVNKQKGKSREQLRNQKAFGCYPFVDREKESLMTHFGKCGIDIPWQSLLAEAVINAQIRGLEQLHALIASTWPHRVSSSFIYQPHEEEDLRLNCELLGREPELRQISDVVTCLSYFHLDQYQSAKPVLFQTLNGKGVGKTFFGLKLAEQLTAMNGEETLPRGKYSWVMPEQVSALSHGSTIHIDFNDQHDGHCSLERDLVPMRVWDTPAAKAFVVLRLMARRSSLWTYDLIEKSQMTLADYTALSKVTDAELTVLLASFARNTDGAPSFLVVHLDEPQLLLQSLSWNSSKKVDPNAFLKDVYATILHQRDVLWREHKILLIVYETGEDSIWFDPTELCTVPISLSCVPVDRVMDGLSTLRPDFPEDEAWRNSFRNVLGKYGVLGIIITAIQRYEYSKGTPGDLLLTTLDAHLQTVVNANLSEMHRRPLSESEQCALLVFCYCALLQEPLPTDDESVLRSLRKGGYLLATQTGGGYQPADVLSVLYYYRHLLRAGPHPPCVLSVMHECLTISQGATNDTGHSWELQLASILQVRLLYFQTFSLSTQRPTWGDLFSGELKSFSAAPADPEVFLDATIGTKLTDDNLCYRLPHQIGPENHNVQDFIYTCCSDQRGFNAGINDRDYVVLLQAKNYVPGNGVESADVQAFLDYAVQVAECAVSRTVVAIVVIANNIRKEEPPVINLPPALPPNLQLYNIRNAKKHYNLSN